MELGKLKGCDVRVHLYTVPGQVQYTSTRKLVLRGVDGVVFVGDSLEVRREKNMLSLKDLQITAFGPDGNIQERAPLSLDLQGPADLLEFEDFITYGNDIRAIRAGQAKIWMTSVMPSSTGDHAQASINLVVGDRDIGSGQEP